MNQAERAHRLAALHAKGNPLILFNIWDAGSANSVADGGAKAIATGSWSVAAAWGYPDGQFLPLDLLEQTVGRVAETVDLPLTVDIEGGYAVEPEAVAENVARIVGAGAVGINFEDGVVGQDALYDIPVQCRRIAAIRRRADAMGVTLFINARTDLFLQAARDRHDAVLDEAITRARAFADAGASGLFVPGLTAERLVAALCAATTLPVNVMREDGSPSIGSLARLGVSRVSHGPGPYIQCMNDLRDRASAAATA